MNLSLPFFDPVTPDDRAPPLPSRAGTGGGARVSSVSPSGPMAKAVGGAGIAVSVVNAASEVSAFIKEIEVINRINVITENLFSADNEAVSNGEGGAVDGGGAGSAEAPELPAGDADPPSPVPWSPVFDLAQHPAVWRASQIGGVARSVTTSGFSALDAQLPGGGWPHGVLTELLLPEPGVGELRLLAPALAAVTAVAAARANGVVAAARANGPVAAARAAGTAPADGRCVMLFDPPALLNAWALVQCGLASRHWLVVQGRAGQGRAGPAGAIAPGAPRGANRLAPLLPSADLLWALEQSLKSGHVGAVLAWLPLNLRADALRRLQLAAQSHDGPVFIFRDALARSQPSPAPLRLLLQPAGIDQLSVRLLKRRGPALAQPLRLALPPVLAPHQQAQAEARQRAVLVGSLAGSLTFPVPAPSGGPARPQPSP